MRLAAVAVADARQGAILPHAPLLVPDVAPQGDEPAIEGVRAATRAVTRGFVRPTVIVSPHGATSGVYLRTRADLSRFGVPRASARFDVGETQVRALAAVWGRPVLDEPIDHGVVVPLLVGDIAGPLVPVAFGEEGDVVAEAMSLAEVLRESDYDVVASVNTGAGIIDRAPLTKLGGAESLEVELRNAIERDASDLAGISHRLASDGGSCCLGPLLVLAALFAGRVGEVVAHEWPYGVGYLVARFAGDR